MTTLVNRYYKFAKMALDLAEAADHDVTHQLCAIVVKKNRVLSVGYNSPKTHPISMHTRMKQLHAEQEAVLRCPGDDLIGSDVFVARCRPSGLPGLSKPCAVCEGILRRMGVRRVFYTINSDNLEMPEIEEMRL